MRKVYIENHIDMCISFQNDFIQDKTDQLRLGALNAQAFLRAMVKEKVFINWELEEEQNEIGGAYDNVQGYIGYIVIYWNKHYINY